MYKSSKEKNLNSPFVYFYHCSINIVMIMLYFELK
jgi:hypothetical protein